MNQESAEQASPGASEGTGAAANLPDINAQTNPFDLVLYNLDLAAFFNILSQPDPPDDAAIRSSGKIIGIESHEALHRFEVVTQPPTPNEVRASNQVGQAGGRFTARWLFIPDDFAARPELPPPETEFDSSKCQRFVMLGGKCHFGDGEDAFEGFGTGKTFPTTVDGKPKLMAAAVGTLLKGTGRFKGKIGTYTYNGNITTDRGFEGQLLIRVMDPDGDLRTQRSIPALSLIPSPDSQTTYVLFHGQKANRHVETEYVFNADGTMKGFKLWQEIHTYYLKWSDQVRREGELALGANTQLGQVIGTMNSEVFLDLLNLGAPGTQLEPIPFDSRNEYFLNDASGQTVGSFVASGGEGRTWGAELKNLPGQQALRFGAFQPLSEGTGVFADIEGLLTDNSIVGVAPHVTTTAYTIRINDPDGRYRTALAGLTG